MKLSGILGILIVIAYAFGSSLYVTNSSAWYSALSRPEWQPPNWVFGVIWPYNFVVLGIASWIVATRSTNTVAWAWVMTLSISVASALRWSFLFYQPHDLRSASIALMVTAISTLPLLAMTFRVSKTVGIALIPYQVWIILAASLCYSIYKRN